VIDAIREGRRAAHESNRKTLFRLLTVVVGLNFLFVCFPTVLFMTIGECLREAYRAVRWSWQGTFDGTGTELWRGLLKQFRDGRLEEEP